MVSQIILLDVQETECKFNLDYLPDSIQILCLPNIITSKIYKLLDLSNLPYSLVEINFGNLIIYKSGAIDPRWKNNIFVKVRSTGKLLEAKVNLSDQNGADVELKKPEDGISPGQACVFYNQDSIGFKVLGGGWIK